MLRRSHHFFSSAKNKRIYDAIIIGGGLSGLQAAYTLKEHSITNVLVLEANDRLGGRIQTQKSSSNKVIELGAAFYGPGQHRMFTHLENFGLEVVETAKGSSSSSSSTSSLKKQGTKARLATSPDTSPFEWDISKSDRPTSFLVRCDINNVLRELEDMMKVIDVADPKAAVSSRQGSGDVSNEEEQANNNNNKPEDIYDSKQQMNRMNFQFDQITVSEFIREHARTICGANYLLGNFRVLMTQDPEQVSLLTLLWFLKSAGGFDALMNGEMYKLKNGNSELINKLAEEITSTSSSSSKNDIEIRKESPVSGIKLLSENDQDTSSSLVEVQVNSHHHNITATEIAKHVIFAVPPPQLRKVSFSPELPIERRIQLDSFKMGNVIKTFTFYEEPFWFKNNFNGRVLVHCDSPHSYDGLEKYPACDIYDAGDNALLGFIDASDAHYWTTKTTEERKSALEKEYRRLFQSKTVPKCVDYVEKNWAKDEPYIGGAFFGLPSGRTLSTYGRVWRDPLYDGNKVLFAGTESANEWSGYMEGAAEAGARCALMVVKELGVTVKNSSANDQTGSSSSSSSVPQKPSDKWPDPIKSKVSQDLPSPDYLRKMSRFLMTLFVGYVVFTELYTSVLMKETAESRERTVMERQRRERMMMMMAMSMQQQQQQQQQQREKETEAQKQK